MRLFVAINLLFSALFCGCAGPLSPATNALSVYDVYSVSRDHRNFGDIASDKFIQTKIQSKILFSSGLSNVDLEIECFLGEVYLIGLIESEQAREKLIELAKSTNGVSKIHEYLRLKKPEYPCSSLKILANLKQNLFTDTDVSSTNVRVSVVGCDVVFSGIVADGEHEKHAIWYARHIDGVEDVYSFLRVVGK